MNVASPANHRRIALLDCSRAACLAGSMTIAAAAVAGAVRAFAAAPVRAWLDFPFGGIPPELSEVAAVLANNVRLLGALLAAAGVAQLALRTRAQGMGILVGMCDLIVVLASANHVFLVGATVGGYGSRGVGALLPHGPIELAAYSLGLSLYVASRRERLSPSRAFTVAGLSVLVLSIAAVVEVMA
jgi:hypothetical protein